MFVFCSSLLWEEKMKKVFLFSVLLFSCFILTAGSKMPGKMTYDEAVKYCNDNNWSLATVEELKTWGGSSDWFWAYEGKIVIPKKGNVSNSSSTNKYLVRCEGDANPGYALPPQPIQQ